MGTWKVQECSWNIWKPDYARLDLWIMPLKLPAGNSFLSICQCYSHTAPKTYVISCDICKSHTWEKSQSKSGCCMQPAQTLPTIEGGLQRCGLLTIYYMINLVQHGFNIWWAAYATSPQHNPFLGSHFKAGFLGNILGGSACFALGILSDWLFARRSFRLRGRLCTGSLDIPSPGSREEEFQKWFPKPYHMSQSGSWIAPRCCSRQHLHECSWRTAAG